MTRPARPLPDALTGRAFSVRQAREVGVDRPRLRRSDLTAPLRGTRIPADDASDLTSRASAAVLVLPRGSALSGVTALRLLGAEVPYELETEALQVTVPAGGPRPTHAGLEVHETSSAPGVLLVGDLPVVTPEQAWLDCARATGDLDVLVVAGDALLRRTDPLSSPEAMARAVHATPAGTRGVGRARRALPDLRPRTDSLMETRTRLLLVRNGLPCPSVNEPVLDDDGRFVAMPDLTFRAARVAIEYDGDIHRTERRLWRADVDRRERLQAAGWLVLTVTAHDLNVDPRAFVARVRRALRARTPSREIALVAADRML